MSIDQEILDKMQLRRAMQIYSYPTYAYVWGEALPVQVLPRNLTVPFYTPFYTIAQKSGRPPVLSYASYALDNWVCIGE